MTKFIATVFGLMAAFAALFPLAAEAGINLGNHNETFVRDRHA